jgi:bifunctional oligoribonuclease and PAP phosphatase NrnA
MAIQDALEFIRDNASILVTTHDSADADGLGAEYAVVKGLRALGKDCIALNGEEPPEKWRFIDPEGLIARLDSSDPAWLKGRAVILLDTNDLSNAGIPGLLDGKYGDRILVVDHHEAVRGLPVSWLDPAKSSTCEMVFELLSRLGAPIGEGAATALFSGISFDTGSFSYSKTGERTFETARKLVEAGASPSRVHALLHESQSTAALLLLKRAITSLEIAGSGRIALQALLSRDFRETGARYEDADGLIDLPLRSKDVEVSVLFKQSAEGLLRCSLRSKGRVNVASIAQDSGGGGHKRAAGFKCSGPLEDEKRAVLATLMAEIDGETGK